MWYLPGPEIEPEFACIDRQILNQWTPREVLSRSVSQSVHLLSHVKLFAAPWTAMGRHARPPCPSPIPGVYSNSCPSHMWCHPTISSSVIHFSSCLQCFPASGSFSKNQFFASGDQSIGISASASVLPMNIQDWFPLGWTDWIPCSPREVLGYVNSW